MTKTEFMGMLGLRKEIIGKWRRMEKRFNYFLSKRQTTLQKQRNKKPIVARVSVKNLECGVKENIGDQNQS